MRLIHAITTAQVKYLTMISMVSKRQELKKIWMLHLPLPMLGTVNDVMYI